MLPTRKEFIRLFEHILSNSPQGNPQKVNLYKNHGYFADMPLKPFSTPPKTRKFMGNTLYITVALSENGHTLKQQIKNPSAVDIIKALSAIQHGVYHSFVILSKSKQEYIQTNVHTLEYRDGSINKHYYCSSEFLSSVIVLNAFLSYMDRSNWWKNNVVWEKVDFKHR